MRKTSLLALVGVLALAASLVVGPAASAKSSSVARAAAGTVVFIHDQEPPNLQNNWSGNNLYATSLVLNNIWQGCEIYNDKGVLIPRLCTGKPKVLKASPTKVRFTFKKNAVWSDGKPVVGRDFLATWRIYMAKKNNVNSRSGWDQIKSVAAKGKTVTVTFKTTYAPWEGVVASGVYPSHLIPAAKWTNGAMNTMFLNSLPVSNGPWKFSSWQKGTQITVVKNTRFHAGTPMRLDRVVFRYIDDTNARFQALKANQGQVMEPQPQLQIADFLKDKKFVVDRKLGFAWEHMDFQFGPQGAPALKKKFVRNAIITGINRPQIAQALYGTIAPGIKPAQSHVFQPFQAYYRQNFAQYNFSQSKVISILKGNGCTGGPDKPSASNDKIWSCQGQKLSFRFFTTSGNELRALTFEIIQRQLKSVGIELVPRFQVAGTLFGPTLEGGDNDIMMFTWVGSPDTQIDANDVYGCPNQGGADNFQHYCNKKLTALLHKVLRTLNAAQRAKLLNQAESQYIAKDIVSIPLFARPVFVIHSAKVHGPVVNPTSEGSPWNANLWALTK